MTRAQKKKYIRIGLTMLVFVLTMMLILPFLWMISTSFKEADEIFKEVPKWLPRRFSFDNYSEIWNRGYFKTYFVNSLFVSFATMGISLVVAMFAGYGISRFRFHGRTLFSVVLIVVQMFPSMLLLIPMYIIMSKLGLLNTHLSMIIAYTTFAMPFCAWMIKGYFDTIPVSLEDAARIDGCGRLRILFEIIMPLAAPGIVTVAMFAFILSWQEYMYALTFARTEEMRTITVGIALMQGQHGSVNWGQIMTSSGRRCTRR
ncbi:carbohydrate ABC transporter permease [Murimonas intestini]|uniref:Carbohydrate ABC transporter membrane protein 2 (CUT1 family) n=1 Tax=Murimonas intestini TaxID=1337051 RepID=A0AB73SXQ7_9FIRM|nr:carbohydrate ABC transporter permease [Murimonas intestini]MCR1843375.1 carbohydrate ABC transporter permease [Murimonas intestini]MCR1886349.1 carbohydrate ABC transporter permease [Murimonas intestini]